MNYQDLDQYVKYLRSFPRSGPADFLQLSRIKQILKLLGQPEKKLKGIQVAGTNGKGSTVAILGAILQSAGYRVGIFTSPHIVSYTERITVNNRQISQQRFVQLIEKVKPLIEKVERETGDRLTWFELLTVVAVLYFAEQKVDICVFEVGLGGRLDATTVLPLKYKVITNIALEHAHILGRTITKIAREKAGIINQRGLRVVTATANKALKVVRSRARKYQAKLLTVNNEGDIGSLDYARDKHYRLHSDGVITTWQGTSFNVQGVFQFDNLKLSLIGRHQIQNALCSLGAIYWLQQDGYQITEAQIRRGCQKAQWSGRFQIVPGKPRLILDASHNPAGIRTLTQIIKDLRIKKQDLRIIFGVKKTKDYKLMLKLLKPVAEKIYFLETDNKSLIPAKELKKIFLTGQILGDIRELKNHGLSRAEGLKTFQLKTWLVTGSIYFLGEFKQQYFSGKIKRARVDSLNDNQLER